MHQSDAPAELRQGDDFAEWWADSVASEAAAEHEQLVARYVTYVAKAPMSIRGAASWSAVGQLRFWSGNAPKLLVSMHGVESTMAGYRNPFMLYEAERRLEQLKVAAATPTLFAGDNLDDEPQMRLSSAAVYRARQILRAVATGSGFMPIDHVSIFPMPDGGLQLQRSGPNSSVSIEIPPHQGEPILAEFAANDEYWSKEFDESADAARFLVHVLR
ncbi:hypothetical protein [Mycobacterium seoulense]|uniref:hypothetical protein n=1 Tax=Mycobacterium seoulense TaxID=386911 RepID=UPI003CE78096